MANNSEKDEEVNVIFRTSLRNTVYDEMSSLRGWQESEDDMDWDINWADVGWIRENFDKLQFQDQQVS